ncbi:hypothetical protein EVAR_89431_1 [Eumeta japonica]|uniref:Uncharacterized protein n=1 Tax=Eumeta variegata TaxID=151549 RepID=A0A4C1Z482_EUMVA|nr:hypothetical protein EVAR_89431_1 [Eumeta japonica]
MGRWQLWEEFPKSWHRWHWGRGHPLHASAVTPGIFGISFTAYSLPSSSSFKCFKKKDNRNGLYVEGCDVRTSLGSPSAVELPRSPVDWYFPADCGLLPSQDAHLQACSSTSIFE